MLSDSDRADQMGQATREKLKQFIADMYMGVVEDLA